MQELIKQMEQGYQEMGELNLKIANEAIYAESEAENTLEKFLKDE